MVGFSRVAFWSWLGSVKWQQEAATSAVDGLVRGTLLLQMVSCPPAGKPEVHVEREGFPEQQEHKIS